MFSTLIKKSGQSKKSFLRIFSLLLIYAIVTMLFIGSVNCLTKCAQVLESEVATKVVDIGDSLSMPGIILVLPYRVTLYEVQDLESYDTSKDKNIFPVLSHIFAGMIQLFFLYFVSILLLVLQTRVKTLVSRYSVKS